MADRRKTNDMAEMGIEEEKMRTGFCSFSFVFIRITIFKSQPFFLCELPITLEQEKSRKFENKKSAKQEYIQLHTRTRSYTYTG